MPQLKKKSWTNGDISGTKKYLARVLTHALSRNLAPGETEVVYESNLDTFDPSSEQPDVVVYEKTLRPIVAIELCAGDDVPEMMLLGKTALERYRLDEFFLFDYDAVEWFRIGRGEDEFRTTGRSEALRIDLAGLIRLQPVSVRQSLSATASNTVPGSAIPPSAGSSAGSPF